MRKFLTTRKAAIAVITILGSAATVISLFTTKNDVQKIGGDGNIQMMGDHNQITLGSKPEPQKDHLNITPQEIKTNWEKFPNDIQAQDNFTRFYKGKRVRWEGTIANLYSSRLYIGEPTIDVYFRENFSASFSGAEDLTSSLSVLKAGDRLSVVGMLDDYSNGPRLKGELFEIK